MLQAYPPAITLLNKEGCDLAYLAVGRDNWDGVKFLNEWNEQVGEEGDRFRLTACQMHSRTALHIATHTNKKLGKEEAELLYRLAPPEDLQADKEGRLPNPDLLAIAFDCFGNQPHHYVKPRLQEELYDYLMMRQNIEYRALDIRNKR